MMEITWSTKVVNEINCWHFEQSLLM